MGTVDIVIPCYKAKDTLKTLIASIASQTYKDKITVILVIDNDDEDYILEHLLVSNLGLKYIIHDNEANFGPGTSRRVGAKLGSSDYIMFIDADDELIDIFAVENLVAKIEKENLDAVNSTFYEELEDKSIVIKKNDWIWVFGKIYRRKFLEDNEIYFNDTRANEDMGFNSVVMTVGKLGNYNHATYLWKYNPNSITKRDNGSYSFYCIEGWIENIKWGIEQCERLKVHEEIIKQKIVRAMLILYGWYCEYTNSDKYDIHLLEKWIANYYKQVYSKYEITEKDIAFVYDCIGQTLKSSKYVPKITYSEFIERVNCFGSIETQDTENN